MWKWECVGVGPVCVCVYVCVCVIVPLLCGGCGAPMFVLVEMDTCMGGGFHPSVSFLSYEASSKSSTPFVKSRSPDPARVDLGTECCVMNDGAPS